MIQLLGDDAPTPPPHPGGCWFVLLVSALTWGSLYWFFIKR